MAPRDLTGTLVRPRLGPRIRIRDEGLPPVARFWAGRSHEPVEVPWSTLGIVLGPSEDVRYCWQVAFGCTIALAKRADLEVID